MRHARDSVTEMSTGETKHKCKRPNGGRKDSLGHCHNFPKRVVAVYAPRARPHIPESLDHIDVAGRSRGNDIGFVFGGGASLLKKKHIVVFSDETSQQ